MPQFEVLLTYFTQLSFQTVRKRSFILKRIEGLWVCLAIYGFAAASMIPMYVVLTEKEFLLMMEDLYKFIIVMPIPLEYHTLSTKVVQLHSNLCMTMEKYPSIRCRQAVFQRYETIVSRLWMNLQIQHYYLLA